MADETMRARMAQGSRRMARHPAVLASIVSMISVATVGWQVTKRALMPLIVQTVQAAVAADTDKRIAVKTAPILEVLKSNKDSDLDKLEDDVSLETLRKQQAGSKWTQFDELKLSQLITRLKKERDKLEDIKKAEAEAKAEAAK